MSSRREELELKKKRLQELRKQREEKEKDRESINRKLNRGHDSKQTSELDDISLDKVEINGHATTGTVVLQEEQIPVKLTKKSIAIQTDQEPELKTKKDGVITYSIGTQTIDFDSLYRAEEEEVRDRKEAAIQNEINTENSLEEKDELPQTVKSVDEKTLSQFFQESLQIINRTIEDDKDVLQSYNILKKTAIEGQKTFVEIEKFRIEDTSEGILSIDCSRFFPELLLVSTGYDLYIYNTKFQKFEHHFRSTTKILNIQFSQFHSNFIFGTGYNGKVLIWNLNETLSLTYLESPIGIETHTYPVWCLDQVNEHAGLLITASTDGKIISWDPQILVKPSAEPIELRIPRSLGLRYDELAPLQLTHLNKEHGFLLIGAEDGFIYKVKKFDTKANKSDDSIEFIYKGHEGPISGLSPSTEWHNIFISSSLDWNIYLWDENNEEPLLQIYKSAAILGCEWRPENPTQLGLIYNDVFEIFDLSIDTVVPVLKINTGQGLNKFRFSNNGKIVYLASFNGDIFVYELLLENIRSDLIKFKRKYIKSDTN